MIKTRTIRPCFAVICCYASTGRNVRCQSGWVASHVRGMWVALRGSGLQIVGLAMRHNERILASVVALMIFLSQSALQAWDVGRWRGLFCSLSVRSKALN